MSNLLAIESSFLNLPEVKQALNLTEIRSVQRTITNAKKKKFEQTLTLSKLVTNVLTWFQSEDGKRKCSEEGITWSNEEIGNKVFGWQKSFFYKVVKAGKLEENIIDTFKTKCDEAESNGEEPNRSLEGLLKFAKQVETSTQTGGQEESESEGNEPQIETRVETIFELKFKPLDGSRAVALKVDAHATLKTNNEISEIENAIAFLKDVIRLNNL
jgi:hypothetical protein